MCLLRGTKVKAARNWHASVLSLAAFSEAKKGEESEREESVGVGSVGREKSS